MFGRYSHILALLSVLVGCVQTASERAYVDHEFANSCEAFEGIGKFALSLHLTKDEADFDQLRARSIAKALGKEKITDQNPTDTSCQELENLIDEHSKSKASFDKQTFYDNLLQSFVSQLDPHSQYYSPRVELEYENRLKNIQDGFGVSFELKARDYYLPIHHLKVEQVISDEVKSTQIQDGDRIVAINDTSVFGSSLSNISKILQKDSSIKLTVLGKGDISIPKVQYVLPKLHLQTMEENKARFLHLKVRNFSEGLTEDFIEKLSDHDIEEYRGIVLDLRTNPGGSLDEAIRFLSLWTDQKLTVEIQGSPDKPNTAKDFSLNRRYSIENKNVLEGRPLVVMIDSLTASAAEIVSGALKKTSAVILGHTSFGKGTGQQRLKLSKKNGYGGTLVLTMFRYRLNSEVTPQLHGVRPEVNIVDHEFEAYIAQKREKNEPIIFQEKDYGNKAIQNDSDPSDSKSNGPNIDCTYSMPEDCELRTAISLLDKMAENT